MSAPKIAFRCGACDKWKAVKPRFCVLCTMGLCPKCVHVGGAEVVCADTTACYDRTITGKIIHELALMTNEGRMILYKLLKQMRSMYR